MIFNLIIFLIMLVLVVLCFICAYQFSRSNWLQAIAGYNTLPKAQQEKVNQKWLCRTASRSAFWAGVYVLFETIILQLLLNNVKGAWIWMLIIIPTLLFFTYTIVQAVRSAKEYKSNQFF